LVRPAPVRSVKVSEFKPKEVVVALVKEPLSAVSVPVAVTFAAERLPERSALPCTEKSADGEVVPIPMLFEKYERPKTSKTEFEVVVADAPMMTTSEVSAG